MGHPLPFAIVLIPILARFLARSLARSLAHALSFTISHSLLVSLSLSLALSRCACGRGEQVSVLVLWSNVSASVDAASPGTAHTKKGSRAKGEREKGRCTSTWAIRVNQCQGGSLHIGCVSNAYKSSNAYAESKEWGMVAVMGEAYNLRHTAYFLGSSGQVRTRTHTHAHARTHIRTHTQAQSHANKHPHTSIHTQA